MAHEDPVTRKAMNIKPAEETIFRTLVDLSRPGDGNRVHLRILLDDADRQSIEVGADYPLNTILTAIPKAMKKDITKAPKKSDMSRPSSDNLSTAPEPAITNHIFYQYIAPSGLPRVQFDSLFKPNVMVLDGHPWLPLQKTNVYIDERHGAVVDPYGARAMHQEVSNVLRARAKKHLESRMYHVGNPVFGLLKYKVKP